jgi:integration host factor subunit alpha
MKILDIPLDIHRECQIIYHLYIHSERGYERMTLTKAKVVENVYEELDLPRRQCVEIVESLLEIMKRSLENGEDVLISGFGKFMVKEKKARRGRNPATGDEMMLDPRRVVTFKCSGKLRDMINNQKGKS